jgi:hypothetical protein
LRRTAEAAKVSRFNDQHISMKRNLSVASLPLSKPKFVSLAELFDLLGRTTFGADWTTKEISAEEMITFEEALLLQASLRDSEIRIQRYVPPGVTVADYVDRQIQANEDTGDLDLEWLDDPNGLVSDIYNIAKIRSYLSARPALKDREAWQTAYDAFQRKQSVLNTLREFLTQEFLLAYESTRDERRVVSSSIWGAQKVEFNVAVGSAQAGPRKLSEIFFVRDTAERLLPLSRAHGKRTANQARLAEDLICEIMSQSERRTKSDVRAEVTKRFNISDRNFNDAWRRACELTGSGWDKSGRPPLSDPG